MPSKSEKQRKFMQAAAHSKSFAKKAGIPQSVARDFYAHDKKRKTSKNIKLGFE